MKISMLISLFLFAGCLLSPSRAADTKSTAATQLFPTPAQGLVIEFKEPGTSLLDVLVSFEKATGQHLVIGAEARVGLQKSSTGLSSTINVPAAEIYSVVETLMIQNGFALDVLRTTEPRMLAVRSLEGQSRATQRWNALWVDSAQVESFASHPAILVTTRLDLDSTDVRTLSNSMRTMFTDANTQQIIPVGNSNTLLITGFGSNVASIARMLTAVNEAEREALKRNPSRDPMPAVRATAEKPAEKPAEAAKPR